MINRRIFTTALALLTVVFGGAIAISVGVAIAAPAPVAPTSVASWQAPIGLYELDPETVMVSISARRFAMPRIRAQFRTVGGTLQVAEDGALENTLMVEIVAAHMEANGPLVESILKGENFLNVEVHPSLGFAAAGFEISEAPQDLMGDLTMAGRANPVVFEARLVEHSVEDGAVRMRFSVEGAIARSDWGMTANRGFVRETIQVRIEAEFVRTDKVVSN